MTSPYETPSSYVLSPSLGSALSGQGSLDSSAPPRHSIDNPPVDMVNHPPHYKQGGMEVIEVMEAFGLMDDHLVATTVKYLLRYKNKGGEEDLRKGLWYLSRRVKNGGPNGPTTA